MAFDQYEYINDFKRKNYDRAELLLAKGTKQPLILLAKDKGMTLNELFIDAVEEKYKVDLTTKNQKTTKE